MNENGQAGFRIKLGFPDFTVARPLGKQQMDKSAHLRFFIADSNTDTGAQTGLQSQFFFVAYNVVSGKNKMFYQLRTPE
jgi:hypothetical protein